MSKRRIELGLLYSLTGTYCLISAACRTGALRAIEAVNSDPDGDIEFVPVERDPGGNIDAYGPLCEDILRQGSARHVVGCITSWSRKEVIPTLEKYNGSLWYTVPYEGFEASDHVVYTHACPNQHLLPLLDWAMPVYGRRVFLTGSNYIWGWEMNRLARETVVHAGGEILGERYLPIGSTEVGRIIDELRATRPDFIMNSLVGESQYAFLEALLELSRQDAHFSKRNCPVLSCNLTECELSAISPDAAEGLIAAGPYFRGAAGWPFAPIAFGSSHEAAAYRAVRELARLLSGRPGLEKASLSDLFALPDAALTGIDRATHHTKLPVLIAQVEGGAFVVRERLRDVWGDPYLSRLQPADRDQRPQLRVVPT